MKKNKYFDLVVIISIIFLCAAFTNKTMQNDTFYTIKIGNLIMQNGIDMKDHFSWISNLPYTYPHWLYDVFISILYNFKGFPALYISNIFFYSIIGFLIYFISKQRTNNYLFSFVLTIIIIGFLTPFVTTRAQMISFIIFILEKYFLDKFLQDGKLKDALVIILLSILLINVHLATWIFFYVLFLPPIAGHYLSLLLKKIRKNEKDFSIGLITFKTNKNVHKLFIIIACCLLTGFLTPLGTTPYTYIFNQFTGHTLSHIGEYQNITINNCFSFFQLLFVLLILLLFTKEKIEVSDLFLLLGLILMSLTAIRSYAYLLIIGFFVVSNYIGNCNKKINANILKKMDCLFHKPLELLTIFLCFAGFGTGLLLYKYNSYDYIDEKAYPVEATKYIKEKLNTDEIKLFNEYSFGSYLIYNDVKVFIDSRSDLYTKPFNKIPRDIFDDYTKIIKDLDYHEPFDYYGITHILLYTDSNIKKVLDEDHNYKAIYEDDNFVLYERLKNVN